MATNTQYVLASRPSGLPEPGKTFARKVVPLAALEDGEVLVRVLLISLDPAMRGWLIDRPSYLPPVKIDEVMRAGAVGEVVNSKAAGFAAGDLVQGTFGWQEFYQGPPTGLHKVPNGVKPELALSAVGMTGMTAYFGLLDVGKVKEGDVVLVSGAAGATGSVVGQIAKIKGCRVIGLAGTPEKCDWLRSLGFDEAICYRGLAYEQLAAQLRKAAPKGIDVFFDNVGGETLDAGLALLRMYARVVVCGAISQYNNASPRSGTGIHNTLNLIGTRSRMEGFIVFDYASRFGEASSQLLQWVQEGRLKNREDIVDGLDNIEQAFLRLFSGANTGKLLVRVAPTSRL